MHRTAVLFTLVLLTACGDSNGNPNLSSGSASTPTASSSVLNTGEIKPTSDATYFSAALELDTSIGTTNQTSGTTTGGTTSGRIVTLGTPMFVGSYSSQTGYALSDAPNKITFGSAQFTNETTSANSNYPSVNFASVSPPNEDYLALYKESATSTSSLGSGKLVPVYGGTGGWQHTVVGTSSRHTRVDYFGYGSATSVSAMPRSGIVHYISLGSGNYASDNSLFFASEVDNVTVDFGAGTIKGLIELSGQNFYANEVGGVAGFSYSGTISGNTVDADLRGRDGVTVVGKMHLYFIGPAADEFIIVYTGQDRISTTAGASVGVRNPYGI